MSATAEIEKARVTRLSCPAARRKSGSKIAAHTGVSTLITLAWPVDPTGQPVTIVDN